MATEVEQTYRLSILVELKNDSASLAELQQLVDEVLIEDATMSPWEVRPFFESDAVGSTGEGFYEVEGWVPVSPSYSVRELGFDLAADLSERLVGSMAGIAMPDFPSDAFGNETIEDVEIDVLAAEAGGASQLAWPLETMRCAEAWALVPPRPEGRQRGEGIVIGHPDTGYTFHRELVASMDLENDFDVIDTDNNAQDPMKKRWWWPLDNPGHGTSTGSVIVSTETALITGSAPAATIVPLRTIRSVVQVSDGDVARSIDRAVAAGAHVISMSLGGVGFYGGIKAALRRARSAGVIVMAAAGNQVRIVVAPARFDECIAVAATDSDDKPWSGSSRGDAVLIAAPGHRVPVAKAEKGAKQTSPTSATGVSSGTSYAVAHLAGVAALWLAYHGRDHLIGRYGAGGLQTAFEHILANDGSRRPPDWQTAYGEGVLDALGVLEADLPAPELAPEAVAESASESPVDRLADLLSVPVPQVRSDLCDLLKCAEEDLDELVAIHGPELAYVYAESQVAEVTTELAAAAVVHGSDLRRSLASAPSISRRLRRRVAR